jgi:RNA polymerase sigma-70 factor (ECF subfamily)
LVQLHHRAAWRTARVLLADPGAVEDALQEAWLDVWHGLPRFQPDRPLRPWLLSVVAHRCQKFTRRRTLPVISLESAAQDLVALLASDSDVAAEALHQETVAELAQAFAALAPAHQTILELHYYAELDQAEIGLLLHLPLGTVKSRLHRALHALRLQVSREEEHA